MKNKEFSLKDFNKMYKDIAQVASSEANVENVLNVLKITGMVESYSVIEEDSEYIYIVKPSDTSLTLKKDQYSAQFSEVNELDGKKFQLLQLEKEIKEICDNADESFSCSFLGEVVSYNEENTWWSSSSDC